MRTLLLVVLLAGCATAIDPTLREARDHVAAGRTEPALVLLERASREHPNRLQYRAEYVRVRDLASAQGLAQAETLRSSGQPEAAAALYRRVQKHDPDNVRARAGLQQLDIDARHRGQVAAADNLIKNERYLEAQDALRPVLVENPQQRDARRLQRAHRRAHRHAGDRHAAPEDRRRADLARVARRARCARCSTPSRAAPGVSFVLDRDVRADVRTTIVLRNAQPEELIRLVLSTNQLDQKVVNETTRAGLSRTRRRSSASTRSWW